MHNLLFSFLKHFSISDLSVPQMRNGKCQRRKEKRAKAQVPQKQKWHDAGASRPARLTGIRFYKWCSSTRKSRVRPCWNAQHVCNFLSYFAAVLQLQQSHVNRTNLLEKLRKEEEGGLQTGEEGAMRSTAHLSRELKG